MIASNTYKLIFKDTGVHRIQTVSAFTSVAGYAGPSSSLQTTPEVPVLLSEVHSGLQHLLGLISGLRRGRRGIPISSLVVEMDLLLSRRLRLSNSCPSSPVPVG